MYLFDFDGTLLESNQVWEDIDAIFLAQRGEPTVPQDYTDYVTQHGFLESAVYTKERYGLPESPEEIVDIWREMGRVAYGETLPLKPGARELLQRLYDQGETICLLTSCIAELCHLALERHGLTKYFQHVFTAGELGMKKRNPETYQHVASLCNVAPEVCTFFDDSPFYCRGAREAGMTVVGVKDALFADRIQEMEEVCHRYLDALEEY